MPFRRHFGFISMEDSQQLKANSQKLYHTVAHELAHGAFGLEHPWQSKGTTQGGTYNLLDYTAKTPNNLLRKYQWYITHNPKMSLFGGDEEETSSADENPDRILDILEKIRCAYISGKYVKFEEDLFPHYFPTIASEIKLLDGKTYDKIEISIFKDTEFKLNKLPGSKEEDKIKYKFGNYITISVWGKNDLKDYLYPNDNDFNTQTQNVANTIEEKIKGKDYKKGDDEFEKALEKICLKPHCVISKLGYKSKLHLLNTISDESYQETVKSYKVIELLASISQSKDESKSFIKYIEKNPAIIASLYNGTDQEGGKLREKYINNLETIFNNYWSDKDINVTQDKHFYPNGFGYFTATSGNPVLHDDTKYVTLTKWKISDNGSPVWDHKKCNPLEPVALVRPTLEKGKDNIINYVPAIYVHYIDEELADENIMQFLEGAGFIAGGVSGAGLVLKGASAVQELVGLIEVANVITTLTLKNKPLQEKLNETPEGRAFLRDWPVISTATDLVSISVSSLNLFVNNGRKVLSNFDAALPELPKQRIKNLVEKCESVAKGGSKLVDRLDEFKGIKSKIDAFNDTKKRQQFLDDFADAKVDVLKKLDKDGELVDAWEVLKDAPTVIRLNERWLKFVKNIPPDYKWTVKVKSGTAKIFDNENKFLADITENGILIKKGRQGRFGLTTVEILIEDMVSNTQKTVKANTLKFMQSGISNHTGDVIKKRFVLKNVRGLLNKEITVNTFDPIKVWKNKSSQGVGLWTLDHRRLTAYRLAGIEDIPVEWVSEYEIIADAWKMTTKDGGINMELRMFFDKNTGKFVHEDAGIDKFFEEWLFKKSENKYKVFDKDGNEIDLNNLDKYLD